MKSRLRDKFQISIVGYSYFNCKFLMGDCKRKIEIYFKLSLKFDRDYYHLSIISYV